METLQSIEQFEKLKNKGKHLFVFSADWCPDCHFANLYLSEVEEKYKEYTFILIDRDEFLDLCGQLDIYGIPSFVAYEDGKELGRFVSRDRKTKEEVESFIESLS